MNHALVQSSNLTWDMFQTVATPSGVSTLDPWKIMFIYHKVALKSEK